MLFEIIVLPPPPPPPHGKTFLATLYNVIDGEDSTSISSGTESPAITPGSRPAPLPWYSL
jgi:hypothetical protein